MFWLLKKSCHLYCLLFWCIGVEVDVSGHGKITVDISYGGAFYAFVTAQRFGLNVRTSRTRDLVDVATAVSNAVKEQVKLHHPDDDDLAFLYGTIVTDGDDEWSEKPTANMCVFAEAQVCSTVKLVNFCVSNFCALKILDCFVLFRFCCFCFVLFFVCLFVSFFLFFLFLNLLLLTFLLRPTHKRNMFGCFIFTSIFGRGGKHVNRLCAKIKQGVIEAWGTIFYFDIVIWIKSITWGFQNRTLLNLGLQKTEVFS